MVEETDIVEDEQQIAGDAVFTEEDAEAEFLKAVSGEDHEEIKDKPDKEPVQAELKNIEAVQAAEQPEQEPEQPVQEPVDTEEKQPEENPFEAQLKAEKARNDELMSRLAALEKKLPEPEPKEPEIPEDIKALYDDYPEIKDAILLEAERIVKEKIGDLPEKINGVSAKVQQQQFERAVVSGYLDESGKYVPGHNDLFDLAQKPEFIQAFQAEVQRNPAVNSSHVAAHEFISRFKADESKKAELAAAKKKQAEDYYSDGIQKGNSTRPGKGKTEKTLEQIFQEAVNA